MRSYDTARGICSFLEFLGWVAVVGGGIIAAILAESVSRYARPDAMTAAFLPGLLISLTGLLFVGAVQGWRSSVDTAEYTQQMLKIARDQLEVSRQAISGKKIDLPTFAGKAEDTESPSGVSFADNVATETDRQANAAQLSEGQDQTALPSPKASKRPKKTIEYRGHKINQSAAGFLAHDVHFDTLEEAEKFLDERIKVDRKAARNNPLWSLKQPPS